MVGVARLELAASSSQTTRASQLRHTPTTLYALLRASSGTARLLIESGHANRSSDRSIGWCHGAELNHRHKDFQSSALPLSYRGKLIIYFNIPCQCLISNIFTTACPERSRGKLPWLDN